MVLKYNGEVWLANGIAAIATSNSGSRIDALVFDFPEMDIEWMKHHCETLLFDRATGLDEWSSKRVRENTRPVPCHRAHHCGRYILLPAIALSDFCYLCICRRLTLFRLCNGSPILVNYATQIQHFPIYISLNSTLSSTHFSHFARVCHHQWLAGYWTALQIEQEKILRFSMKFSLCASITISAFPSLPFVRPDFFTLVFKLRLSHS